VLLRWIDGEQSFFPVYEPTQEELKARYKVAEGGSDGGSLRCQERRYEYDPFRDEHKGLAHTISFSVDAPDPQSGRKEQVSTSLRRTRKSGDDRWKS
jgi:hypothetical protein